MPTYTYKCESCHHQFDRVQKITEEPLDQCPVETCKGEVKRLIALSHFHLKGGGWYKDGY